MENNEFKLKMRHRKESAPNQPNAGIQEVTKNRVPIIRNDKFIPQHFVDAVFDFKFVLLQCIQIAVFVQRFLEIEYKSWRTQSRFLPNQRTGAGVLQKFWQKFQNISLSETELDGIKVISGD